MFKFRKKKETTQTNFDAEMFKILNEHLDIIQGLQDRVNNLLDNDREIHELIRIQRDVIIHLQDNYEELQKLNRKFEES